MKKDVAVKPAAQYKTDELFPPLSHERTKELIQIILHSDSDREAAALMVLVGSIAFEPDRWRREDFATWAINEAYGLTFDRGVACDAFIARHSPSK